MITPTEIPALEPAESEKGVEHDPEFPGLCSPAGHGAHDEAPGRLKKSSGHDLHVDGELAPMAPLNFPEAHRVHSKEPERDANVPASHREQLVAPSRDENCPAGHAWHASEEDAPGEELKVPRTHGLHADTDVEADKGL
jgi:hypothetical protein